MRIGHLLVIGVLVLAPGAEASLSVYLAAGTDECREHRLTLEAPGETWLCSSGPSLSGTGVVDSPVYTFRMSEPFETDVLIGNTSATLTIHYDRQQTRVNSVPRPNLRVLAILTAENEEDAPLELGQAEGPCGNAPTELAGSCTLTFDAPSLTVPAGHGLAMELRFLDDVGLFVPSIDVGGEDPSRIDFPDGLRISPVVDVAVAPLEEAKESPGLAALLPLALAVAFAWRRRAA